MGGNFPGGNFSGWQFSGWQLSWVAIFRVAIFLGGNFPGGNYPGGNLPGGIILVAIMRVAIFRVVILLSPFRQRQIIIYWLFEKHCITNEIVCNTLCKHISSIDNRENHLLSFDLLLDYQNL